MLAAAAATAHCSFCHGCCFASPYGALFVLLSDVSGLMSDGWILFPAFVIRVRVRVQGAAMIFASSALPRSHLGCRTIQTGREQQSVCSSAGKEGGKEGANCTHHANRPRRVGAFDSRCTCIIIQPKAALQRQASPIVPFCSQEPRPTGDARQTGTGEHY